MKNEQYEKMAIDFCIANGFDAASFRRFVKFAEDLVDKGVLVEAEKWTSIENKQPDVAGFYLTKRKNSTGFFYSVSHHDGKPFPIDLTGWYNVTQWMVIPGESTVSIDRKIGKYTLPFRVGRKQKRALLDANGLEVVIFPEGNEDIAELTCVLLNTEYKNRNSDAASAGKEVKSIEDVFNDHVNCRAIDVQQVFIAMEEYASQFKSSPASKVKVISDEDIKKYLRSYYSDRPEVQNLHLAAIRAIQWYREQLNRKA